MMFKKIIVLCVFSLSCMSYAYGENLRVSLGSVQQESFSPRLGLEWQPVEPISFLKLLGNSYGVEYGQKVIGSKTAHDALFFSKLSFHEPRVGLYYKMGLGYTKLPKGSSTSFLSSSEVELGFKMNKGSMSFEMGQGIRFVHSAKDITVNQEQVSVKTQMFPSIKLSFGL